MNYRTYEGKEPYVFISYAHKDSEQVLKVVHTLMDQGYRIWYDDGITPGSEWPENIAQHLAHSAMVMAFVSSNFIASPNCRREVSFGLSKNIPFLGIFLEETEMSMGMEMQLSSQQCIMKYAYDTEQRFYDKVYAMPELKACRRMDYEVITEAPELPAPTDELTREFETIPTASGVKDKTKKKKNWLPIVIGGIVLAAVLCGILLFAKSGTSEPQQSAEPEGETIEQIQITEKCLVDEDEDSVSVRGETLSQDALEKISKLENLHYLYFTEVDFSKVDMSALQAPGVRLMEIKDCSGIKDYSFLKTFTELKTLRLERSGVTDDSIDLSELSLETLDVIGNPGLTDLKLLIGDNTKAVLREIQAAGTGITDISVLAETPELYKAGFAGCEITDIDSLADLEKLSELDFTACKIEKIQKEFKSLHISQLYLGGNGLTDISGCNNLSVLGRVDLSYNKLESLPACVENSAATIKYLNVSQEHEDWSDEIRFDSQSVFDSTPEAEMVQLVLENSEELGELYASGVALTSRDAELLQAGKSVLNRLDLSYCDLYGTLDLSQCPALISVDLSCNQLDNILLPEAMENKINQLDLSCNRIESLTGLGSNEIKVLKVHDIDMTALEILTSENLTTTSLALTYDDSILETTKEQADHYNSIYVFDTPKDKQAKMENISFRYKATSLEEYEAEQ